MSEKLKEINEAISLFRDAEESVMSRIIGSVGVSDNKLNFHSFWTTGVGTTLDNVSINVKFSLNGENFHISKDIPMGELAKEKIYISGMELETATFFKHTLKMVIEAISEKITKDAISGFLKASKDPSEQRVGFGTK